MPHNNDLHEVEMTIEDAQRNIDKMNALLRLRDNRDFKLLIDRGYFEEEAARLVLARAEPGLQTEEHQVMLDKMIDSVGYLRQYFNKIYQFGQHSQQAIEEHRETRDEIMAEAH